MKSSIKISNNGNTIRATGAAANALLNALTAEKTTKPKFQIVELDKGYGIWPNTEQGAEDICFQRNATAVFDSRQKAEDHLAFLDTTIESEPFGAREDYIKRTLGDIFSEIVEAANGCDVAKTEKIIKAVREHAALEDSHTALQLIVAACDDGLFRVACDDRCLTDEILETCRKALTNIEAVRKEGK